MKRRGEAWGYNNETKIVTTMNEHSLSARTWRHCIVPYAEHGFSILLGGRRKPFSSSHALGKEIYNKIRDFISEKRRGGEMKRSCSQPVKPDTVNFCFHIIL